MRAFPVAVALLCSGCLCTQPARDLDADGWSVSILDGGEETLDAAIEWSPHVTASACWSQAFVVGPFTEHSRGAIAKLPGGDALVVWAEATTTPRIFSRRLHADGGIEPPSVFWSSTNAISELQLSVASNETGHAIVVWHTRSTNPLSSRIFARRLTSPGVWSPAEQLNTHEDRALFLPRVGIANDGDALLTWIERIVDPGFSAGLVARRNVHGVWLAPTTLAENETSISQSELVTSGSGEALAMWLGYGPPSYELKFDAAQLLPDGGWSVETVGAAQEVFRGPSITLKDTTARAFWVDDHRVTMATRDDGGWATNADIFATDGGAWPGGAVSIDIAGSSAAIWQTSSHDLMLARENDGGWSAPEVIATLGSDGVSPWIDWATSSEAFSVASWAEGATLVATRFGQNARVHDKNRIDGIITRDADAPPQLVVDAAGSQWLLATEAAPPWRLVVLRCQ